MIIFIQKYNFQTYFYKSWATTTRKRNENNIRWRSHVRVYNNNVLLLFSSLFSSSRLKRTLTKWFSATYVAEKPVSWMMMAPSLTPNKSPGVSNNPGLRLYKFNKNSGHVSTLSQVLYLTRWPY